MIVGVVGAEAVDARVLFGESEVVFRLLDFLGVVASKADTCTNNSPIEPLPSLDGSSRQVSLPSSMVPPRSIIALLMHVLPCHTSTVICSSNSLRKKEK